MEIVTEMYELGLHVKIKLNFQIVEGHTTIKTYFVSEGQGFSNGDDASGTPR